MRHHKDSRVLVLDDDPFMLALLEALLADLGFRSIVLCEHGRDALERIASDPVPPDLILCDLVMPEMDGPEFIRSLARSGYTGSIVLISGEDVRVLETVVQLVASHRLDVAGYLLKPITRASLADLLATSLHHPVAPPRPAPLACTAEDVDAALSNQQLVNFYQPIVATRTGQVVAVETLLRWQHPQHGLLLPGPLVAAAEDSGRITALTLVVLRNAIAQAERWKASGISLNISVNVSTTSLRSLSFPDAVDRLVADSAIAPPSLTLEITESQLIQDVPASLEVLSRLRLKRFRLSIDDFGLGASSLARLRDLPFNELKIDRSFGHGAWRGGTPRTIYSTIAHLARSLGMTTVVEGLEDFEDWRFASEMGCESAQGRYIAAALPGAVVADWLTSWRGHAANLGGTSSARTAHAL